MWIEIFLVDFLPFFRSIVYNRSLVYVHQNFLKVVVHVIIIDQWNQTALLYEIHDSRAILVTVTSVCRVKEVICKTWTGTLANSSVPDQTSQNAASDQGLQCLLKLQDLTIKCLKYPFRVYTQTQSTHQCCQCFDFEKWDNFCQFLFTLPPPPPLTPVHQRNSTEGVQE